MRRIDLETLADTVSQELATSSVKRDKAGEFAADNHHCLRTHKLFSALIPLELDGGGCKHKEMAAFLRKIAKSNASTALALAMHQHLVAAAVYNHGKGRPGRKLLDKVAAAEAVLISTGANDWMESNGHATRTDGGYIVTAHKPFASGSPAAVAVVTSARYDDPVNGAQVLHFSIPLQTEGLSFADDWDTMGMRESGSQTMLLEKVFVPDEAIILSRPRDGYGAIFDVALPCALPLIMSVYLGIAEEAVKVAITQASKRMSDEVAPYLVGEMLNLLTTAQVTVDDMLAIANDLDFVASIETTNAILMRKTITVNAVMNTVEMAMETAGGSSYFRKLGIERMLRDIHAAQFHPMQEKRQHRFSGRFALGLDPIR